ncbi:polymorphic toxin type 44 domain-containing protein [Magnetofaba australis]|uniref:polymorphic toxin type 44 domain-containing protein n=1 Tax=Magnetofaba australis TaxID=1472297 RepID=UPI001301ED66|nr:polymorphic toxin type 44 domain-containing protein [Magnetofaba australis]
MDENVQAAREATQGQYWLAGSKWFYDHVKNAKDARGILEKHKQDVKDNNPNKAKNKAVDWALETMDYKQYNTKKYENFGNFNYGPTAAALGIPEEIALRGAGFAQTLGGNHEWKNDIYTGNAPYGDDPKDQWWIQQGINYYKKHYAR